MKLKGSPRMIDRHLIDMQRIQAICEKSKHCEDCPFEDLVNKESLTKCVIRDEFTKLLPRDWELTKIHGRIIRFYDSEWYSQLRKDTEQ